MNRIRLVATDMDGTLLNSKKEKPADFIPWVKSHPEIKTVIASGRPYFTLREEFDGIEDDLVYIADNGGFVYDGKELLYVNEMDAEDHHAAVIDTLNGAEDLHAIIDIIEPLDNVEIVLCGAKYQYQHRITHPEIDEECKKYYHVVKYLENLHDCVGTDTIAKVAVCILPGDAERIYGILKEHLSNRVAPTLSGAMWIDVSNRSVSKGGAMQHIQEKFHIAPEHCMAFGDFPNDLTLLKSVGESYCMENGHDDVKAIAKYITDSNDNDGVMKVHRTL